MSDSPSLQTPMETGGRRGSRGSDTVSLDKEKKDVAAQEIAQSEEPIVVDEQEKSAHVKYRPLILFGLATVILGWWISATVLKATRHRW
jgi:concentrative nucleoside transporter, CNT family